MKSTKFKQNKNPNGLQKRKNIHRCCFCQPSNELLLKMIRNEAREMSDLFDYVSKLEEKDVDFENQLAELKLLHAFEVGRKIIPQ